MSQLSCSILAIFFILILNHLIRLSSPVARTCSSRHTTKKPFSFFSSLLTSISLFLSLLIRVSSLALSEKHFQLRCQFFDLTIRSFLRSLSSPSLLFDGTQAKWCFSCHDLSPTYFRNFFYQIFLTFFSILRISSDKNISPTLRVSLSWICHRREKLPRFRASKWLSLLLDSSGKLQILDCNWVEFSRLFHLTSLAICDLSDACTNSTILNISEHYNNMVY